MHTVHLKDGYELHIIREPKAKRIILSLDKRSDEGWVHERITIEIPFERAYRMAKFICGIIEMDGVDHGDQTHSRISDIDDLNDFGTRDTDLHGDLDEEDSEDIPTKPGRTPTDSDY